MLVARGSVPSSGNVIVPCSCNQTWARLCHPKSSRMSRCRLIGTFPRWLAGAFGASRLQKNLSLFGHSWGAGGIQGPLVGTDAIVGSSGKNVGSANKTWAGGRAEGVGPREGPTHRTDGDEGRWARLSPFFALSAGGGVVPAGLYFSWHLGGQFAFRQFAVHHRGEPRHLSAVFVSAEP